MRKNETIKAHVETDLKESLKKCALARNLTESQVARWCIKKGVEHLMAPLYTTPLSNKFVFEHQKKVQTEMLAAINTLTSLLTDDENSTEVINKKSIIHFSELQSAEKLIKGIEKELNRNSK